MYISERSYVTEIHLKDQQTRLSNDLLTHTAFADHHTYTTFYADSTFPYIKTLLDFCQKLRGAFLVPVHHTPPTRASFQVRFSY